MRGYRLGLNLARLLKNYWKLQSIVPKSVKCIWTAFGTGIGVTQVDPTSPMIFNIVVDAVLQAVREVVCCPQEAQHGMELAAGERNLMFYSDDKRIAGRYQEWVQDALTVTVAMFRRMGIYDYLKNTKAMVFTPEFIWEKWGYMAYK